MLCKPNLIPYEIGPKTMGGFSPVDHGFARFSRVRIPKENMLSKFAQVTDDGQYVKPPHAKLSYGGVSPLIDHDFKAVFDDN